MFVDYVMNGVGHGEVGQTLASTRFDTGLLRPYINENNQRCVTINTGRTRFDEKSGLTLPIQEEVLINDLQKAGIQSPVFNATSLRKDEWQRLDQVVLRAARPRMRAWADLAASNTYGGFNGMSKTILEHETMSDPGEAVVDMDGLTEGRTDAPKFQLEGLPLPITHSDFWFSSRVLAVSRNTGTPLDTTMGEAAGRRVGEMIEKTTIGTVTGMTYGRAADYNRAPTVYGYTNFPGRITKTDLHTPAAANPEYIVEDVLEMIDLAQNQYMYGPYMLYHSTGYSRFLNDDYFRTGGTSAVRTVRERVMEIEGITDIRRLDYLTTGYQLLLVQMTPEVARAVIGMDITTVQWESNGGMKLNFKVMCIMVPQLREDYNGNCGIVHGTTS